MENQGVDETKKIKIDTK